MTRALQATFAFILAAYSVHIYRAIETTIHPVVVDFEILNIARAGRTVTLSGEMTKARSCEFKRLMVYGARAGNAAILLDFRLLDSQTKTQKVPSRARGRQFWGDWEIYLPENLNEGRLSIYSIHDCWPFWKTETRLATLDIPQGET